jgi:hypothetical protein
MRSASIRDKFETEDRLFPLTPENLGRRLTALISGLGHRNNFHVCISTAIESYISIVSLRIARVSTTVYGVIITTIIDSDSSLNLPRRDTVTCCKQPSRFKSSCHRRPCSSYQLSNLSLDPVLHPRSCTVTNPPWLI